MSIDGGAEPVWRRDGGALYYRSYGKLMMAQMSSGSALAARVVNGVAAEPGTFDAAGYDTMSGERFLMITSALAGHRGLRAARHPQLDAGVYFFTLAVYCPLPSAGPSASPTALIMSSIFACAGS